MTTLEEITKEAKALPPIEQERLIEALMDARHAEQTAKIGRRIAEIDSGEVDGIPYEEVMQKLRARIPNV